MSLRQSIEDNLHIISGTAYGLYSLLFLGMPVSVADLLYELFKAFLFGIVTTSGAILAKSVYARLTRRRRA